MKPINVIKKLNEADNRTELDRFADKLCDLITSEGLDCIRDGDYVSVIKETEGGTACLNVQFYEGGNNLADYEVNYIGLGGDTNEDITVEPLVKSGWEQENGIPSGGTFPEGHTCWAELCPISNTSPEEVIDIIKKSFDAIGKKNESSLKEESRYSSIEDDDPVLDKTIKVYDINAFVDKEINKGSEEKYQAFEFKNGAAIIVCKDGTGCIVDYEAIGESFNATSDSIYLYICPEDKENEDGSKSIHIMATAKVKCTIDELMTAPSKEMKVRDFFNKWDYNDRCARNFEGILKYLKEDLNESDEQGFDTLEDYKDDKIRCFNYAWQEAHALKDKVYNSYWNRIQAKEKLEKAGLDVDGLKESTEIIADHLDALGELLQKEDKGLKEAATGNEYHYIDGANEFADEGEIYNSMANSDVISILDELERYFNEGAEFVKNNNDIRHQFADGEEQVLRQCASKVKEISDLFNSQMDKY